MSRQTDILNMNENADNKRYKFMIVQDSGAAVPTETLLEYAPDGWKDEITIERSEKYKGLTRSYSSNELKFPKDGRQTLINIYESKGIKANAVLVVYKWDNDSFAYVDHYTGRFDFSTYLVDELFVSIQVLDDSLAELVKNRENIEVDILDDTTIDGATFTALDSKFTQFDFENAFISTFSKWESNNYSFQSISTPLTSPIYTRLQMDLGFSQMTQSEDQTKQTADFFYRTAPDAETMRMSAKISGTVTILNITGDWSFKFVIRDNSGTTKATLYDSGTIPQSTQSVDFEFVVQSAWFGLASGADLKGEFAISAPWDASSGDWSLTVDQSSFTLELQQFDLSQITVTGLQYYEAFHQVLRKITGEKLPLYSEFFGRTDATGHAYSADGQLGAITKGQLIRGLDTNVDVSFPVTFEELFDALNAIYNIGMGIETVGGEEKVRIESWDHFFDDSIVLDLSARISENEVSKEVLPDWHYAQIKSGYDKFKNEVDGALFEFNGKQTFASVLTSLSSNNNTLDILSKYRADSNGINLLRSEHDLDNSEDVDGDDDIFVVDCVRDVAADFISRTNDDFDLIDGADEDSSNLLLTPTRNLLRWGAIIRAGLEKADLNTYLRFQSTERKIDLSTRLSTEANNVDEMSDILVNDLDQPRWWPEAYSIECPFYTQDLQTLYGNLNGIIKLSDTMYGWILEINIDADDKAKLKLLRVNLNYVTPT